MVERFGRWTVVEERRVGGRLGFLVLCDCGIERAVRKDLLTRGVSQSCGCRSADMAAERLLTHGGAYHRLYGVWQNMIARCHDPKHISYPSYGGRGIKVCRAWQDAFEVFRSDVGEPPTPKHTIDRINNDRGYEPSNCRWATIQEQSRNKRNSVVVEFRGERITLAEAARSLGLHLSTLRRRAAARAIPCQEVIEHIQNNGFHDHRYGKRGGARRVAA